MARVLGVRYPADLVLASTGAADRCRGRSTSYPGLVYWLGALEARPDQRRGTFAGVEVFIVTVP